MMVGDRVILNVVFQAVCATRLSYVSCQRLFIHPSSYTSNTLHLLSLPREPTRKSGSKNFAATPHHKAAPPLRPIRSTAISKGYL